MIATFDPNFLLFRIFLFLFAMKSFSLSWKGSQSCPFFTLVYVWEQSSRVSFDWFQIWTLNRIIAQQITCTISLNELDCFLLRKFVSVQINGYTDNLPNPTDKDLCFRYKNYRALEEVEEHKIILVMASASVQHKIPFHWYVNFTSFSALNDPWV